MDDSRIVSVGHSHVVAIANAYYACQKSRPMPHVSFAYLNDPPYLPNLEGGAATLNPHIKEFLVRDAPSLGLLAIGGNEHNVMSMLLTDPPYDFVLADEPDLRSPGIRKLLPEKLVLSTFRKRLAPSLDLITAIREATSFTLALFEPPAPLPRGHVVAHPGELLRPDQTEAAIASDVLRYKYWRLQTKFYREHAARMGLAYIVAPPETRSADGMLVAEACGSDATHANAWFGERMLERALSLLAPQGRAALA